MRARLIPLLWQLVAVLIGAIIGFLSPTIIDLVRIGIIEVAYDYTWIWILIVFLFVWGRRATFKKHGWLNGLLMIVIYMVTLLICCGGFIAVAASQRPNMSEGFPTNLAMLTVPY